MLAGLVWEGPVSAGRAGSVGGGWAGPRGNCLTHHNFLLCFGQITHVSFDTLLVFFLLLHYVVVVVFT